MSWGRKLGALFTSSAMAGAPDRSSLAQRAPARWSFAIDVKTMSGDGQRALLLAGGWPTVALMRQRPDRHALQGRFILLKDRPHQNVAARGRWARIGRRASGAGRMESGRPDNQEISTSGCNSSRSTIAGGLAVNQGTLAFDPQR
jgi:hypothetical protein